MASSLVCDYTVAFSEEGMNAMVDDMFSEIEPLKILKFSSM